MLFPYYFHIDILCIEPLHIEFLLNANGCPFGGENIIAFPCVLLLVGRMFLLSFFRLLAVYMLQDQQLHAAEVNLQKMDFV